MKLTKAEVPLAEARADYEDFIKPLNEGTDSIQILKLVKARFSTLPSLRLSGLAAKSLRETKEVLKKKKKAIHEAKKATTDVSVQPIRAEEIGTLVQREVNRQMHQALPKRAVANKT